MQMSLLRAVVVQCRVGSDTLVEAVVVLKSSVDVRVCVCVLIKFVQNITCHVAVVIFTLPLECPSYLCIASPQCHGVSFWMSIFFKDAVYFSAVGNSLEHSGYHLNDVV